MKKTALMFGMILCSLLSACAVHTREGSIIVDPDRGSHPHGHGDFCPPGQAKKGHC